MCLIATTVTPTGRRIILLQYIKMFNKPHGPVLEVLKPLR